jgi:exodeoxyribonuclease-3
LKLATWNVNSIKMRLPRVLEFLEQHRPDVLCMQETKTESAAFPHAELAAAGYTAVDQSAGRWAGVAIAARNGLPLTDVVSGLPGEIDTDEARWIEADVAGMRVCSTYVPNGRELGSEPFASKLAFLDAMAVRAGEHDGAPLVMMGDMNIAPTDLDVYDPEAFVGSTHVSDDERHRLGTILAAGFVDAYAHIHPGEVGYTWWDYRQGHFHRGMGLRIDLALVAVELAPRIVECGIDRNYRKGKKPSDHAPLLVELSNSA